MKSLLFISIGLLLNIKNRGFYILIPISDILVVIFLTCFDLIRLSSEKPNEDDLIRSKLVRKIATKILLIGIKI